MNRDFFESLLGLVFLAALASVLYLSYQYYYGPERPWYGYATRKLDSKKDVWFTAYETRRDCKEQMNYLIQESSSGEYYHSPLGCVYLGNDYLLTYLVNWLELGDELTCIIKYTNNGDFADYEPMLRNSHNIRSGDGWYCV